jgi:hypothetical protein
MGDYKHQEWPKWFFGPNDRSGVFDSADDVPTGWVDHPSKVKEAKAPAAAKPATKPTPADAGTKAGRPKAPITVAREAYKAAFGKGATPKMTLDEINAKLAEHTAALDL